MNNKIKIPSNNFVSPAAEKAIISLFREYPELINLKELLRLVRNAKMDLSTVNH